ncbi:PhzF family phenazine biosynthesis protein [Rouxiella badensis]|uniref:PhzF family phenazine biosynthesis protein n=1 Tax=Rouxiella badensis TaxID=1646377 RepID=UPI0017887E0B|nr:PhzF family phenazine biosynthesis protein [Rouxiella badensis]QOI53721.1 PhzF family phenazine biosynthesis protein [Rouxiella badensis subsp. acadiensis]WAT07563.1 PhzF family phenazine biosynthesis protein [Rouxiella badensis]
MSVKRRFKQVDVFTAEPLKGNPLAVVLDAEGLSDAQLQAFARWTNLSETTFALPPTDPRADYRVRIFTPDTEFPFAGHPTLGTAHALLESGLVPKTPGTLIQECGVGLVSVKLLPEGGLAFAAPSAEISVLPASLYSLLDDAMQHGGRQTNVDAWVVTMGISWLVVRMPDAEACLRVKADIDALAALQKQAGVNGLAIYGPHPPGAAVDYEVRALLVEQNQLVEDPVTGSANACLARVLQQLNFPDGGETSKHYRVRQGTQRHRDGRVFVRYEQQQPWIGGETVTLIDGSIRL